MVNFNLLYFDIVIFSSDFFSNSASNLCACSHNIYNYWLVYSVQYIPSPTVDTQYLNCCIFTVPLFVHMLNQSHSILQTQLFTPWFFLQKLTIFFAIILPRLLPSSKKTKHQCIYRYEIGIEKNLTFFIFSIKLRLEGEESSVSA